MLDNTEKTEEVLKDFAENIERIVTPILENIEKVTITISNIFTDIWKSLKNELPHFEEMKISRKRFVKLLMSIGYQRNEANNIAWKYHEEKGKYTFLDFIVENSKKEE